MPEQNRVQMRGGVVLFIGGRARLARHHAARHVMMPREFVQPPRGDLILHASPPPNLPRFSCEYPFLTDFEGCFGGLPELKMGHAAYRRKSLDVDRKSVV